MLFFLSLSRITNCGLLSVVLIISIIQPPPLGISHQWMMEKSISAQRFSFDEVGDAFKKREQPRRQGHILISVWEKANIIGMNKPLSLQKGKETELRKSKQYRYLFQIQVIFCCLLWDRTPVGNQRGTLGFCVKVRGQAVFPLGNIESSKLASLEQALY